VTHDLNIVSVSGGKDSTVVYLLALDEFGKDGFRAVFADTGHEHPVTYNYLRNLPEMAGGPSIEWVKGEFSEGIARKNERLAAKDLPPLQPTGNPFLDMMLWKGRAPSTKAQFCTEHLKLAPIKKWLDGIRGDREVNMSVGIRAGESVRRSKMAAREFSDFYDCWMLRPIIAWDEAQVFSYLETKGVPPNPLYAAGFSRVGCFPCIHSRKGELAALPEWAWEKLADWEKAVGRTWFPPGLVPGVHIPTIEDVRAWAKTAHGGRQFDLLTEDAKDVPSCMSTWVVCE
jgi:3'-phosphoadenosine 5'-phosphosulfate sulfotransferase (PAPS reductase)/FAD synthetase